MRMRTIKLVKLKAIGYVHLAKCYCYLNIIVFNDINIMTS